MLGQPRGPRRCAVVGSDAVARRLPATHTATHTATHSSTHATRTQPTRNTHATRTQPTRNPHATHTPHTRHALSRSELGCKRRGSGLIVNGDGDGDGDGCADLHNGRHLPAEQGRRKRKTQCGYTSDETYSVRREEGFRFKREGGRAIGAGREGLECLERGRE